MARLVIVWISMLAFVEPVVAQEFDAYAEVEQRVDQSYADAITEYDAAIAANPGDIMLEIQRCHVSSAYVYATEYYVEGADEDATDCYQDLLLRYPGVLVVELANLAEIGGEEARDEAMRLHDSNLWTWNRTQHAELHEFIAGQYYYGEEPEEKAEHCLKALQLDRRTNCRITVAEHFIGAGQPEKAVSILSSPLDPHDESYYLLQKLALLSKLGAVDEVREQYRRIDFETVDGYQYVELATQLADVGLKYEAIAALNKVGSDFWDPEQFARAKFDVSIAIGDYDTALVNYNLMRDLGIHTDPFLRARFELAGHDASLPWKARDLLAIFPIFGATLAIALLVLVIPALVHYRGLARKARAYTPGLSNGQWRLRHAWYALFSVVFGSVLTLFIYEYDVLLLEFTPDSYGFADWSQVDLVRLMIAESFIVPLFLIPLLIGRSRLQQFWTRDWSIPRCIGIAFVAAILLRVAYLIPVYLWSEIWGAGQAMTTEQTIVAMYEQHGALMTYLLVALLTPLVEEFVFRGVLLQGFAQHVSYRWANILQALIFASLHENLVALPLLFAFGLVAGILTRKAGGLLPAIILHAFFNVTAIIANTSDLI
ncbi:MAG: CPBP family glutamic-type intramembrane protease [Woeseiaceae bacterium]